jgi:hypothetical protein
MRADRHRAGNIEPAPLQALPERVLGIMANSTLLAIAFFTFMGLISSAAAWPKTCSTRSASHRAPPLVFVVARSAAPGAAGEAQSIHPNDRHNGAVEPAGAAALHAARAAVTATTRQEASHATVEGSHEPEREDGEPRNHDP